jgi:two-component system response regulator QseB
MRILLVGQNDELADSLRESFWARKADVNYCHPTESIVAILKDQPDIVCIDTESSFALPTFFLELQKLYATPGSGGYYPIIIGIIPRQTEIQYSRIYLDLGFDLVFQKPVDNELLFSQINALDRRIGIGKDTLVSPHLLINTRTQDCYFKSTSGTLIAHFRVTPLQFSLLKILIDTPRGIWSRDDLAHQLSTNTTYTDGRAVDKTIHRIRKVMADQLKTLSEHQQQPWQITTGYKYPFIQTEDFAGYYFFDRLAFPGDAATISSLGIQSQHRINPYETPGSICDRQVAEACRGNSSLSPLAAETLLNRHLSPRPQAKMR